MQNKLILLPLLIVLAGLFHSVTAQTYNQRYGGLGIQYMPENNGYPVILKIQPDMPAEAMHLQPNDLITSINNQSTYNFTENDIANLLSGPVGSSCSITVRRNNDEYALSFYRADLTPRWEPGKTLDYYHITAAAQPNSWNALPGYQFYNPGVVGDLRTVWTPGIRHPGFPNVTAADREGYWNAAPGYQFLADGDLRTFWKPGLLHPVTPNIVSAEQEGHWVPVPGYTFIYATTSAAVRWTPGLSYQDIKITSAEREGTWYAFPGYVFLDPQKSLQVVWQAGLTSPNNSSLVSGYTENTWVTKTYSTTASKPLLSDKAATAVTELGFGALLDYMFGKNMVSKFLYQQSIEDGYHAITDK